MKIDFGGLDEYALTHLAAHIYSPGPAHYPKLFKLIQSHMWFAAQAAFDPTRRHYADSLSLGLRALGERPLTEAPDLPAALVVLALLRATVASLASNLPSSALEALSTLGKQKTAGDYAKLLQNEFERSRSLCSLASAAHRSGDVTRARDLLSQADREIQTMQQPRSRAHALVTIAETAIELEQPELKARYIRQLSQLVEGQNWPVSALARELKMLDQPDYLLALMDWDRREGLRTTHYIDVEKYSGLPALVKPALARGDKNLLAVIMQKSGYYLIKDQVVEALASAGAIQDVFRLIDEKCQKTGETLSMRESAARGAGQRGDVDTILRAARYSPPVMQAGQPTRDSYDSWQDRLTNGLQKGLKSVGGRLVGEHPDVLSVYLEGMSSLQEEHPEKVPVLVQLIEKDLTRLGRSLSGEVQAYLKQFGATTGEAVSQPRTSRLVGGLLSAGVWLAKKGLGDAAEISLPDALITEVVWTATQGNLDKALRLLAEIEDSTTHDVATVALVEILVVHKKFQQALELASRIQAEEERKNALELIVSTSFVTLPQEKFSLVLEQVIRLASRLPDDLNLFRSGLIPVLAKSLVAAGLEEQAQALLASASEIDRLEILTMLAERAAGRQDQVRAEKFLQELEKVLSRPRLLNVEELMYEESAGATRPVRHLAELSAVLSNTGRQMSATINSSAWQALALRTYNLADSHPLAQIPHTWVWLAQAAANLGNRETLQRLIKRKEKPLASGYAEQARVYLITGLARLGDYLEPEKDRYPPFPAIVTNMVQKHNQALALAELALVLRQTPPQKRGLFKILTRQDLDVYADSLMKHSLDLLQISDHYFTTSQFRPWLKTSQRQLSVPGLYSQRQSQLPSISVMGAYLPQTLRLIEIYCQSGLSQAAERLAGDITQLDDRAEAFSHLIRCLLLAGQGDRAQAMTRELKSDYARWLGWLSYIESYAGTRPDKALEDLLKHILPFLWLDNKYQKALPRLAVLMTSLPASHHLRAAQSLLYDAGQKDRKTLLQLLVALLPGLAARLDRECVQTMVAKILETETWW